MNELFIQYMKNKKKSERTIESYCKIIDSMLDYIGKSEEEITTLDISDWESSFINLSSSTINVRLSAVSSYFHFLEMLGLVDKNPVNLIDRPSIKNKAKPYLSQEQAQAIIDHAKCRRDKAFIIALLSTGMRFDELASIKLSDYLKDKHCIKILGKGAKERMVYFNDSVCAAIDDYLENRYPCRCEYLFVSNQDSKLNSKNTANMIRIAAKRAGIPFWDELANHALRAACATIMSENNVPVATIRDVLGHSSISTTSRYIKKNEEAVKNASFAMNFS
nr:MAG TPA: SITE SPECIFIC RECOMBINASE XERD [Caudoviricetes sp.]